MSGYFCEEVVDVQHWNDTLFSFRTTRDRGQRFLSGQFVMLGLEIDGRPFLRAYSLASGHYEEHLEFYSIKVPNGPLTSRLQHLRPGDKVLVGKKATGTLIQPNLLPGKRLYLLATGTGLAPFMSIIRDPEFYEIYDRIILVHGVRYASELGYRDFIEQALPGDEFMGELVRQKLVYYPTVTREPFRNSGRLTHLIETGALFEHIGEPALDPKEDRVMICGSTAMLEDLSNLMLRRGFVEGTLQQAGSFVVERAFVGK